MELRSKCWSALKAHDIASRCLCQVIGRVVTSSDEQVSVKWKPLDERSVCSDVSWEILQCDVPAEHKHPKYGLDVCRRAVAHLSRDPE